MKSKISLFNKAIFKNDISRFWPGIVILTVLFQLLVTLPLYSQMHYKLTYYFFGNPSHIELNEMFWEGISMITNGYLNAVVAIFVAILLFSYLHKEKEAWNLHAFPVTRSNLFFTHILFGVIAMFIPNLITIVACAMIANATGASIWAPAFAAVLFSLMQILFFLGIGVFVMVATGNAGIALTIYFVLQILGELSASLMKGISDIYLYGPNALWNHERDVAECATPLFYTSAMATNMMDNGKLVMSAFGVSFLLLIPAAAILILSWYLYQRRDIEQVGEMMAFNWAKAVFRLVFAITAGLALTCVVYEVFVSAVLRSVPFEDKLVPVLIMVAIMVFLCHIVSEMIVQKNFFVFRTMPYGRSVLLVMGLLLWIVWTRPELSTECVRDSSDYVSFRMENVASEQEYAYGYILEPKDYKYGQKMMTELTKIGQSKSQKELEEDGGRYITIMNHRVSKEGSYRDTICLDITKDMEQYLVQCMKQKGIEKRNGDTIMEIQNGDIIMEFQWGKDVESN